MITDKAKMRVVKEKQKLDDKLAALGNFLNTETCASLEDEVSDLLRSQYVVMNRYSEILGERIKEFS